MKQWMTSGKAGNAGDNGRCPVDDQRILRLLSRTPCAGRSRRSRKALTTKHGCRSGGDPGTPGETPGRGESRETGASGGRPTLVARSAADSSRETGQPSDRHAGLRTERGPSISYMEGPRTYSAVTGPATPGNPPCARMRAYSEGTPRLAGAGRDSLILGPAPAGESPVGTGDPAPQWRYLPFINPGGVNE